MGPRPHPPIRRGRRRPLALAATAALVLTIVVAACGSSSAPPPGGSAAEPGDRTTTTVPLPAAASPTTVTTAAGLGPGPVAPSLPRPPGVDVDAEAADPVRIDVPRVGISAPVVPLGLDPAGALDVPTDFGEAGWWTGGPEPGEPGPAVVAGHVDSTRGPAVFYRLRELRPGDTVTVHRADGSSLDFVVDRLEQHPKAAFPTDAVYGPTTGPELRLITCGGAFDRTTGHYLDNHIAYAHRR